MMAISESAYLEALWERNICAYCQKIIPEGGRVGSGKKADGAFCSLDCFAKYHVLKFGETARLLKRNANAQ